MPNPKDSILTTVYNREKYLAACIESVLASTHKELAFIIYDEGYQDEWWAIASEYIMNKQA